MEFDQIALQLPAQQRREGHLAAREWLYQYPWTHFVTLTFPGGETSYWRAKNKLSDMTEDLERMLYLRRLAGRIKEATIFYAASFEDRYGFNKHLHVLLQIPPSSKLRPEQSIESLCKQIWIDKYRLGHQIRVDALNTTEDRERVVDYTLKQILHNPDRLIIFGA